VTSRTRNVVAATADAPSSSTPRARTVALPGVANTRLTLPPDASSKEPSPSRSQLSETGPPSGSVAAARKVAGRSSGKLAGPVTLSLGGTLGSTRIAKLRVVHAGLSPLIGPLSWLEPQATVALAGSGDAPA
jgi:hypothetical protein